jgi:hypothetical protein
VAAKWPFCRLPRCQISAFRQLFVGLALKGFFYSFFNSLAAPPPPHFQCSRRLSGFARAIFAVGTLGEGGRGWAEPIWLRPKPIWHGSGRISAKKRAKSAESVAVRVSAGKQAKPAHESVPRHRKPHANNIKFIFFFRPLGVAGAPGHPRELALLRGGEPAHRATGGLWKKNASPRNTLPASKAKSPKHFAKSAASKRGWNLRVPLPLQLEG